MLLFIKYIILKIFKKYLCDPQLAATSRKEAPASPSCRLNSEQHHCYRGVDEEEQWEAPNSGSSSLTEIRPSSLILYLSKYDYPEAFILCFFPHSMYQWLGFLISIGPYYDVVRLDEKLVSTFQGLQVLDVGLLNLKKVQWTFTVIWILEILPLIKLVLAAKF